MEFPHFGISFDPWSDDSTLDVSPTGETDGELQPMLWKSKGFGVPGFARPSTGGVTWAMSDNGWTDRAPERTPLGWARWQQRSTGYVRNGSKADIQPASLNVRFRV